MLRTIFVTWIDAFKDGGGVVLGILGLGNSGLFSTYRLVLGDSFYMVSEHIPFQRGISKRLGRFFP